MKITDHALNVLTALPDYESLRIELSDRLLLTVVALYSLLYIYSNRLQI